MSLPQSIGERARSSPCAPSTSVLPDSRPSRLIESPCVGVVRLVNPRLVRDSMERAVILGRNTELVVYDEVSREKLRQKLPNGTRLRAEPDAQVDKGQVLAEWDPHTLPVITEASGLAFSRT